MAPELASGVLQPPLGHRVNNESTKHQHLVKFPEVGKLGLLQLLNEEQHKDWCTAFEMALDDH